MKEGQIDSATKLFGILAAPILFSPTVFYAIIFYSR